MAQNNIWARFLGFHFQYINFCCNFYIFTLTSKHLFLLNYPSSMIFIYFISFRWHSHYPIYHLLVFTHFNHHTPNIFTNCRSVHPLFVSAVKITFWDSHLKEVDWIIFYTFLTSTLKWIWVFLDSLFDICVVLLYCHFFIEVTSIFIYDTKMFIEIILVLLIWKGSIKYFSRSFNASSTSCKSVWILNSGLTQHMSIISCFKYISFSKISYINVVKDYHTCWWLWWHWPSIC